MTKAANTLVTPDPSGDIHRSRLEQADAPILALGAELRENRAAVDAESDRADALQEANPDDAETRAAAWAIRDACRPLTYRYHAILNELRDQPALTLAGMAVKSRAILQWLSPGGDEIPGESEDGRVAWSLAHDVLRMADAMGLSPTETPDAELTAACAEFEALEMTYLGLFFGPTRIDDDRERDASDEASGRQERQKTLQDVITGATAMTLDGLRAKARCAAAEITDILTDEDAPVGKIGSSIIRDLVGGFDPVAIAKGDLA